MTDQQDRLRPDDIIPPDGHTPVQARKLITDAALLLPNIVKLVARLLKDSRVPRRAKITLALAGAYVLSPIDLIPEMIPVLGWADDVVILMFALDGLISRAGPGLVEEHWDGPGDLLGLVREVVGLSRAVVPRRISAIVDRLTG